MWKLFQGAEDWIRGQALRYRERHPDEPLRLYFMPPSINEMFRGMQTYDPPKRVGVQRRSRSVANRAVAMAPSSHPAACCGC